MARMYPTDDVVELLRLETWNRTERLRRASDFERESVIYLESLRNVLRSRGIENYRLLEPQTATQIYLREAGTHRIQALAALDYPVNWSYGTISQALGYNVKVMRLVFAGKELDPDKTFTEQGIWHESVIHVVDAE